MHPITRMVQGVVELLVRPEELEGVRETEQEGMLRIDIRVRGRQATGAVIGKEGETIRALRHLAQRAGKLCRPPMLTAVEVANLDEEESQGTDTTAERLGTGRGR